MSFSMYIVQILLNISQQTEDYHLADIFSQIVIYEKQWNSTNSIKQPQQIKVRNSELGDTFYKIVLHEK